MEPRCGRPASNTTVSIDMTVEESDVSREEFESAFRFVDDLGKYDAIARKAILDDLNGDEDPAAKLYVSHHLSELTDRDLAGVFGAAARETIEASQFLSRLNLVRVGDAATGASRQFPAPIASPTISERRFRTEERPLSAEDHADTISALRIVFRGAMKAGNPVRWS